MSGDKKIFKIVLPAGTPEHTAYILSSALPLPQGALICQLAIDILVQKL